MHENSMDVFIVVRKIQYKNGNRVKLKADFWNLGYSGKPFPLEIGRTIDIKDITQWKVLTDEDLKTKRIKPGHPRLSRES